MRLGIKLSSLAFPLILLWVVLLESARAGQLGKDILSGVFEPSVDEKIALTVKDINKALPKMISEGIRLDPSTAGPGRRLTYNYTVYSEDILQSIRSNLGALQQTVCNSKDTRFFLSKGAVIVYSYHSPNGLEQFRLTVVQSDCR